MLFDSHAHINFSAFKDDRDQVIKRALEKETWIVNVGSQYSTSQRAVKITNDYEEGIFAAIGLHPIHLSESRYRDPEEDINFQTQAEEFDAQRYCQLAEDKKVVAIGETGLDYYHLKSKINPPTSGQKSKSQGKIQNEQKIIELQKNVFKQQIELACEINKPLIVHCREAHADIIAILAEEKKRHKEKLRGVIHCFSGKTSQAKIYIELGFLLGFTGIITFARDYDKVIKEIDMQHILIETDCPYLAPLPYRGSRNEPVYVRYVAEKIAEIREIDFAKVAQITSQNARDLFRV